jgi:hypothetical protein
MNPLCYLIAAKTCTTIFMTFKAHTIFAALLCCSPDELVAIYIKWINVSNNAEWMNDDANCTQWGN